MKRRGFLLGMLTLPAAPAIAAAAWAAPATSGVGDKAIEMLIAAPEMVCNPPLVIRGGMSTYAGGITWVDCDYVDQYAVEVIDQFDRRAHKELLK